jgi:hypothetical protein
MDFQPILLHFHPKTWTFLSASLRLRVKILFSSLFGCLMYLPAWCLGVNIEAPGPSAHPGFVAARVHALKQADWERPRG